ncbi:MAG: AcrR family transcriptional regulator [Maribacter sp.]|jgi:AcrR family transcriptional regulator
MKKTKRQIILEIAATRFSKKGFAATSMRDLAKEVGMEAASLYNHIKSKQEILGVLLLDAANQYMEGMDEVEKSDASPIKKIESLISLHIKIALDNPDTISLMTQEWIHLEGDAFLAFSKQRKDYENRFKNILIEGIKKGEIKDVNPDIALFSILSTMRWFYAWYSRKDGLSLEELERQFCDVLIKGISE